jgi:hypothetical protein
MLEVSYRRYSVVEDRGDLPEHLEAETETMRVIEVVRMEISRVMVMEEVVI